MGKRIGLCLLFILLLSFILPVQILASSIGIANYFPLADKNIAVGDIVSFSPQGYHLSNKAYDQLITGVIIANPAITIEVPGATKTYPVINIGDAVVNVSGINGNLKKGDFITTSTIPGVGQKAVTSGYVIGASVNPVSFASKNEVRQITVSINIHFQQFASPVVIPFLDVLNLSEIATYEDPVVALKLLVALLVILASFGLGFLIFSKTIHRGIEAIGRNPLAGQMIELSILLNVIMVIIILLTGIFMGYLILRI
ncbi:MAG TPA: hypothetical protein VGT05_04365 [Patescibacteria group bacterium]|nr:hypothetical protein [Patescibacteria group bacterium]